jgi:flagellar motility protein MotE (MotC chaperone)
MFAAPIFDRQKDPFKEPYIDRPPLAHAELSPELKRLIEEDPDAATVQFVVKASPVNSSAAQLHTLLTLQAQIQEKEKTVLNLEKTLTDLRYAMEDQIQKADGALRERESVIRELQASNEKLIGWVTKYKNAKEKLLPTGSLRDRAARKLAGILLTKT